MQVRNKKAICLLISLFCAALLLSGCTNYKKKSQGLEVELKNKQGLLEQQKSQNAQLEEQVAQSQQTIEELQRKIEEGKTAGQATGFEGDVRFDPTAGTITVTLPNTILFAPGKATLRNATSKELDNIASVIQSKYASSIVDVIGHTDSDPIKKSQWKDNWELSSQRSLSVVRYLSQHGIPSTQLRAVGRGDTQPIASNSTESGKAKNRRVEVVVHLRKEAAAPKAE